MQKKRFLIMLLLLSVFLSGLKAQDKADSLTNKNYGYLLKKIDEAERGSQKQLLYLNAYLDKAWKGKSNEQVSFIYRKLSFNSGGATNLQYADSAIVYALKTKNNDFISRAYLARGDVYYSKKKHKPALDDFIIANNYSNALNNNELKYEIRYSIANIKFYLGFYDEAAALFKECAAYFKSHSDSGYLASMHALSLCYNRLGNYTLCSKINTEALIKAQKVKDTLSESYIYNSEGINQYSKRNFNAAIQDINRSLPYLIEVNSDFATEAVSYFYLGKSYLGLGKMNKALEYFKKVDISFGKNAYTRPDLRENYEILINYYKEKDNVAAQLYYVNRLIKVDSIINTNYKYLSGKIYKEYDTRALLKARTQIEQELTVKRKLVYFLYAAIVFLFTSVLVLLYRHYSKQKAYKKRFGAIMDQPFIRKAPVTKPREPRENDDGKKPDISIEVIEQILAQLDKFEQQKKYRNKELTLADLALTFKTNANYLSKVINHYKGKNFNAYINELRVEFIIELLKEDNRYRNFAIKALAEEAGFANAQHFSKAFFSHTGIYPSFFISELNKTPSHA